MKKYKIAAFYKFVTLEDYKELRKPFLNECSKYDLKGTIILALEGINATIAGTKEAVDSFLKYLSSDIRLSHINYKFSYDDEVPFYRMKVKLKKELIQIGIDGINPNEKVGTYVDPKDWNELVNNSEVLLVDTRNNYEVEVGTFKGAIKPDINNFREFPDYVRVNLNPMKHKKVAMFCTGGIRCEKASSFMMNEGFEQVYHLKGGILKYLEDVPSEESIWEGECFVFDNRTSVDDDLGSGEYTLCSNCRSPLSPSDRKSDHYEEGISCPRCFQNITKKRRSSLAERQRQMELAKKRNEQHLGFNRQKIKS